MATVHPAFRDRAIAALIDNLGDLSAGFAAVGGILLEHLDPGEWRHRGSTVNGAPRGHIVDSAVADGRTAAEYGTEVGYFGGELTKPRGDIDHARSLHPQVKRIWLLSSRQLHASQETALTNVVNEYREHDIEVIPLDARAIAEKIVDHLDAEQMIDRLRPFLPMLQRVADEYAFSHRVPSYPDYVSRANEEEALAASIATARVGVLVGVSGAGKSAIASTVAEQLRKQFDAVVWVDASSLRRLDDLSAIDVTRSGTSNNVRGWLRRVPTLLILDNLQFEPSTAQLADLAGAGAVIVTTQAWASAISIRVGDVDAATARRILERGVGDCPDDVFALVRASVAGHALLLGILNKLAIETGGWSRVAVCCKDAPTSAEDERHQKVCERILEQHVDALAVELAFVRWIETPTIDRVVIERCVSTFAVDNLAKRDFLAGGSHTSLRVHDVVFRSIEARVAVTDRHSERFRDALGNLVCADLAADGTTTQRVARVHTPLVVRLLREGARAEFRYALALVRSDASHVALFGDLADLAERLPRECQPDRLDVEVRAIIEAAEATFTLSRGPDGRAAARDSITRLLPALDTLEARADTTLARDIRHHRAKLLSRLERRDEAERAYRAILESDPALPASRLQLARLLVQRKATSEAIDEYVRVVDDGRGSVNVRLAAFEDLARMPERAGIAHQRESTLFSLLRLAGEADLSLARRVVATLAGQLHYDAPDFTLRLVAVVDPTLAAFGGDDEWSSIAQARKSAAKAVGDAAPDQKARLLDEAIDAYRMIARPSGYHLVQWAECDLLRGNPAAAAAVLDRVRVDDRNEFWLQRRAQAHRDNGNPSDAIAAIDLAIEAVRQPGSKNAKYLAAFLNDRAIIRHRDGDPGALDDLAEAAQLATSPRFRSEIQKRIEELRREATHVVS